MKCLSCGFENPDGMKFCGECGTNLQVTYSTSDLRPGHLKTSIVPEPERKHVTALFSDLSGYTSMTEKLDPEQVKEITGRIFTGVKQIVAKYEGFIERVMGDGVLAFFGVPRAHEDDPIRAIHAAREIHDLVKSISPRYQQKLGAPLAMHSGINTGLVVTADVDPDKGTHGVAGDSVNVASRLSGLANPGEILVGHDTHVRAEGVFTFEDLGFRKVKGKADPVQVFKVLSVKTGHRAARFDRQVSSEMVGRDKELDKLEFQVMKAINGEGSVVNVIGEAGIGKSRLIAELKKRDVMKRVTLLEGRAISIGKNLSFHPVIDLLKQWAGIAETDSEAAAFDKLEKAIRAVHPEETNEILPFVATLMGMKLTGRHAERVKGIEGEALEKLIFKNVRELMIKGAELRPTVVVMEDLHWADTSSIELLQALYRLAEKHRIAFINVFRPGYFQSDDGSIAKIGQLLPVSYVEIEIQPLDNDNSEGLIDNMLAIKGLPYSIKHQIVERAGGNPFFIEEVVRSLIDEGAVVKKDGGFEVTDKIERVVIPPTINDVLMARIDRLEERTRELVKVASVIGRSFFDRIIKDVADSIEDVDNRLEYLKDVQLIRDRMRMQELEYLFKHALAQEAAYELTLLQQRKQLHLKVAESIERIFSDRLHEFYGILALHYTKADDLEKAEEYMLKAGEEALRSSASSEALHYYQEALRLYLNKYGETADPNKLASLEKNIGLAYFNKGEYEKAVANFDRVLAPWDGRHPKRTPLAVIKLITDLLLIMASLHLPNIRPKRVPSARVNEFFDLAYKKDIALVHVDPMRGFFEQVGEVRATFKYDLSRIDIGAVLHLLAGSVFFYAGLPRIGSIIFRHAETLVNDKRTIDVVTQHTMSMVNSYFSGRWHEVKDYDESMVARGLREGLFWYVIVYALMHGYLRIHRGEFSKSRICIDTLLDVYETHEYHIARSFHLSTEAEWALMSRKLGDARNKAVEDVSVAREQGLDTHLLLALGRKSAAQFLSGDTNGATDTLREEQDTRGKRAFWPTHFLYRSILADFMSRIGSLEGHVLAGDGSAVSEYGKSALRFGANAVRNFGTYAPGSTEAFGLMGTCYWLIGKQRKAHKWWDKSIKEGEQLGARPDLSRTYFEVGKRLLEPQSKYKQLNGIDAKAYLEKAEVLFKEIGLEHDLDELERVRQGT